MKSRFHPHVLLAGLALAFAAVVTAQDANSIKFSDPGKPGTLKVSLGRGELHIQGSDTNEVTVKSDAKPVTTKRKDGMRVLSSSSGFSLGEKDNIITLDASPHDWGRGGSGDFRITVPRNTTIIVQNAWGGDITCHGISGDIEVNSMRGELKFDDVSGGVVASTMSGEIHANVRELREGKPLSFTTMNGEVVIRVPENAKANVRLRTQNGAVLTDFEDKVLVTKAESTSGPRGKFVHPIGISGKVISIELESAIREATRVSANAVKEALEAVKQGLDESKLSVEEAKRQVDEAKRDMDRARREAERAERDRRVSAARPVRADGATPPTPPAPEAMPAPAAAPKPPAIPKVPTMSGGNLVTGTLNGGGPEISVSTMNGDVTIRRASARN